MRIDRDFYVDNVVRDYMPVWIKGVEGLKQKLLEIKRRFDLEKTNYFVGVCMTAELSDVFFSKDEGVIKIVESVEKIFNDAIKLLFVDIDMNLIDVNKVRKNPIKVAAANWAASAWLLKRIANNLKINVIFIDIGSTTTTIIPIVDGEVFVRGKTDSEKLLYGELVYLGTLRTDITSFVDKIPFKGFYIGLCRERFALVGDIHLILKHIKPEDYTTETADNRGKSIEEAFARLARVICADSYSLNVYEIEEIARYVYETQIFKIFEALIQIKSWIASLNINPNLFTVVVAGIGKHIAIEAAKRAEFSKIIDIDEIIGKPLAPVIPAYGVAMMIADMVSKNKINSS